MITFVTWSAVILAGAAALSVCVLVARRLLLARADRRALDAEERLRPVALSLLDGQAVELGGLSRRDGEVLCLLLSRLGRNVRGASTGRIAEFLEREGWVDRQLRSLSSSRPWRRATAAYVLGDMGSQRPVPDLLSALEDSQRDVRSAAARSLGRLRAASAVEPLVRALVDGRIPRSVAGQALLAIGPAALPALHGLQTAPAAETRAFAVELVGLLGGAGDGAVLVDRLRDTSAEVRAKAARALGRLGAEEGAAELRAALDDRVPFVRVVAATALSEIGDPAAVPVLLRIAREDRFEPARAAARALGRLDPVALKKGASARGAGPHLCEAADLLRLSR